MVRLNKNTQIKLKELKCTIEDDGSVITIDSPHKHVFSANGNHCYCIPYAECIKVQEKRHDGIYTWFRDANTKEINEAIMKALEYGMEECPDPECEICNGVD